ncbi:MAG: hypothetical protein ACRC92_21315 [Peptostreptococcaceae bacterium]
MNSDRIKITFKNDFVRIVERKDVKNFNSLIDWMDDFNSNARVPFLTLTGRDLGSAIALNSTNVKAIEFI